MIKFTETLESDIPQLKDWIEADDDHRGNVTPEFWLTGVSSFVSFCVQDELGPVFFTRADRDGDTCWLHIQFGPYEEVSKRRLMEAVIEGFPKFQKVAQDAGFKEIKFFSTSPLLIRFMTKFGFRSAGADDYVLKF